MLVHNTLEIVWGIRCPFLFGGKYSHYLCLSLFSIQKVLPSLLHGEAVNIDMSYMVYVSKESGLLTENEKQRIISCMVGLELPVWHEACTMELIQKPLQERLKHSGGLVRMPLPVGLGGAGKNHLGLSLNPCVAFGSI